MLRNESDSIFDERPINIGDGIEAPVSKALESVVEVSLPDNETPVSEPVAKEHTRHTFGVQINHHDAAERTDLSDPDEPFFDM